MSQVQEEARLPQRERTSSIALSYGAKGISMLDRLGVHHECDRQTDRRTEDTVADSKSEL